MKLHDEDHYCKPKMPLDIKINDTSCEIQVGDETSGEFVKFNAKTEKFENLMKAGIIDPAKVVRVALQHAASVAGMLLTTECVISDIPEETPAMPPMGGGGMPGMM